MKIFYYYIHLYIYAKIDRQNKHPLYIYEKNVPQKHHLKHYISIIYKVNNSLISK